MLIAPGPEVHPGAAAARRPEPPEHLPAIDYERHPGAATAPLPGEYHRHEPEKTVLYAIVQQHLETFLARPWLNGGPGYPRFIEQEFRRYLDCGLLSWGFSRIRCPKCGAERLVAYSCKGRLCPSCVARRTNDTAARLVDHLLPAVPYRQWVLSFPFALRFSLARDPLLFGRMVSTFLGIVFAWQRHRGRRLGIADGQTGAVTFLQRFGGALNCNPHAHSVVPDGLFVPTSEPSGPGPLAFVPLPPPTDEEVALLTKRIARRLTALARRTLGEEGEQLVDDDEEHAVLRHDVASALAPPTSDEQTSLRPTVGLFPPPAKSLCAVVNGFSLHAARTVAEDDRDALERLCRYGLRSPFSQERLSLLPDGRVVYKLAKPWPTPAGRTELVLDPIDFLRRLAALIPPPYANMIRYHGVFANRSRFRSQLPAPPPSRWAAPPAPCAPPAEAAGAANGGGRSEAKSSDVDGGPAGPAVNQDQEIVGPQALPPRLPPQDIFPAQQIPRPKRTTWAALLRRVFDVDSMRCPRCLSPMVVLAFITDPAALSRILEHLGLPTAPPPIAPARLPVEVDLPFDEVDETPPEDAWLDEVQATTHRTCRSPAPS